MKARYTVVNGEVIAEKRSGTRLTYVPDPLRSTVALLDNSQSKTDTFTYWPYGEVKTRTGATGTPFKFVGILGYYSDTEARAYVRARHLRINHGRWMTVDSLWPQVGAYEYVSETPVSAVDPSGMQAGGASGHSHPINGFSICVGLLCAGETAKSMVDIIGKAVSDPEGTLKKVCKIIYKGGNPDKEYEDCIKRAMSGKGWIAWLCHWLNDTKRNPQPWTECAHRTSNYDDCARCCDFMFPEGSTDNDNCKYRRGGCIGKQ